MSPKESSSHYHLLMTNAQFPHPSKFSVLITKQRLIISMHARNSVKNERNSCSKTDSVLIVPTRTNISARTVIKVHLIAKYVETDTLQSFMICQGQKTRALQSSSACTQVCKEGPIRSCARIVLLKVLSQSDPSKETLTFSPADCLQNCRILVKSMKLSQYIHQSDLKNM